MLEAGEQKRLEQENLFLILSRQTPLMASLTRSNSSHSINVKLHVCQLHQAISI